MVNGGTKTKVAFVPYVKDNPYQSNLERNLEPTNVSVVELRKIRFLSVMKKKIDVIHLHWLPRFDNSRMGTIRSYIFVARLLFIRFSGTKIVWTVHNLYSHDSNTRKSEKRLAKAIASIATSIIVHTPTAVRLFEREFSARHSPKIVTIPHGHYIENYENRLSREQAREKLGINDELVFLFMGHIRPYKGVLKLMSEFEKLEHERLRLLVVGKPYSESHRCDIQELVERDCRVTFRPGYVPDSELQLYFNAVDAVVFPYSEILTSGAVILAMSFGKACIAPNEGCIGDTLDQKGAFLYDIRDEDGLRNALLKAIERHQNLEEMGRHNLSLVENWGWDKIAESTSRLYE